MNPRVQCNSVSANIRSFSFYRIAPEGLSHFIPIYYEARRPLVSVCLATMLTASSLCVLGAEIGPQLQQRCYHGGVALLRETINKLTRSVDPSDLYQRTACNYI